MRNLSPALEIIRDFEKCKLVAYRCPADVWTIGWGTTVYPNGKPVRSGDTCTQEQADHWLMHDATTKAKEVESLVKIPISNNQFCALLSFAYNVGSDIDKDTIAEGLGDSTLLKKLNAGVPKEAVAAEFMKWVKAGGKVLGGLIRRREVERALFLKPDELTQTLA